MNVKYGYIGGGEEEEDQEEAQTARMPENWLSALAWASKSLPQNLKKHSFFYRQAP